MRIINEELESIKLSYYDHIWIAYRLFISIPMEISRIFYICGVLLHRNFFDKERIDRVKKIKEYSSQCKREFEMGLRFEDPYEPGTYWPIKYQKDCWEYEWFKKEPPEFLRMPV